MKNYVNNVITAISSDENGSHQFHALDLLRGIAAVCVVFKHFAVYMKVPYFAPNAYLAVDFFFVLSGFVIAAAYLDRLNSGRLTFNDFAQRRLIRLLPMITIGTLIGAVIQLGDSGDETHQYVISNFLIALGFGLLLVPLPQSVLHQPTSIYSELFPLNTPGWSLFYEIVINLAFALVLSHFKLSARLLAVLFLASAVILAALIVWHGSANFGYNWSGFWSGFARVSGSFFAGVLVYRLRHLAPKTGVLFYVTALVAILMFPIQIGPLYDLFAVFLAFPFIILCASRSAPPSIYRISALSGNLSYPMYAIHYPLVRVISFVSKHLTTSTPVLLVIAFGATIAIIGLSALVYQRVDLPIRKHLAQRWVVKREVVVE